MVAVPCLQDITSVLMKRSLQTFERSAEPLFTVSGVLLIATTYGLARLGFGLFLPAFSEAFALGPALSGSLSSGASVLYCVAAAIGFLRAATRPRAVAVLAGLSAVVGSLGIATAPTATVFAAGVLLASMGAGFASPALVALVQRNATPSRQSRVQAVVNSGTGFGVIAAGAMSLVLGDAWRIAWILVAVLAAASTLGVLFLDRGDRAASADAPRFSRLVTAGLRGLGRPLVGAFLFGIGCSAVWVYGRTSLEAGGMTAEASAGAWIALGAGGACAVLAAPWLAARPITTTWPVCVLGTAGATALIGVMPGAHLPAYGGSVLFGLAYTAASSVLILWASAVAADAAAGTSALFIALVLGQAAGAAATGLLLEAGPVMVAFGAAALACALSTAVVTGIRTPTTAGLVPLHGSR